MNESTAATQSDGTSRPDVELRQHPRVPIEVEVDFVSESNFYQGFSENISEGGVFVSTYAIRPVGVVVAVSFRLPGSSEPIECEGTVCWIREYNVDTPDIAPGFGVRFGNLAPESRVEIEAFVGQREPLFYDE